MKILITTDSYYPNVNGLSYFTQRLAKYLKARGHSIAVIAPAESFKNSEKEVEGIHVYGIRSTDVFFKNNFRFRYCLPFFNKKYIQKIFDEFKPEIVHLQGHFPISRNVLAASKHKGIRAIGTTHFIPENLLHYVPFGDRAKKIIFNFLWNDFAKIFNQLDQVTSPTETAANLVRPKIKLPVKAVSNGIDCKRFSPRSPNSHLREKYKIPNKPNLLYIGRLDAEKHLDVILKAAKIALNSIDFHLTIAGHGQEVDNLKHLAKELDMEKDVTFTGFVPDDELPNFYPLADCFVIASTAELQSLVTMEAMASGLPVIGANAMALPELVHDGENGFQFQVGNIDELAEKIIKIFSDPDLRKRMAEKSLEIISHHDIEKTISAFEELYSANRKTSSDIH